jgi:hypothetical protein
MIKTCPRCGKDFKTYQSVVRFCSASCGAKRDKIKYTCTFCNKEFERQKSRTRKNVENVFCSRQCQTAWRRAQMTYIDCAICGKSFYQITKNRKHCSKKCHDKSQEKNAFYTCIYCGREFKTFPSAIEKGRKYCSRKCTESHMIGENSPHWRGGKELALGKSWKQVRGKVLNRDKVCLNCGAKTSLNGRSLDVHHIHGRRFHECQNEANLLDNLITLCSSCHIKLEMAITHNNPDRLPICLKELALIQLSKM